MKQNEKELLLKDLCARLPYGVKAKYYGSAEECECCDTIEGIYLMDDEVVIGQYGLSVDRIKPYLFPLSSMTEKQAQEYNTFSLGPDWISNPHYSVPEFGVLDWLNANHLDYRNLIGKGLALDATGLNIY